MRTVYATYFHFLQQKKRFFPIQIEEIYSNLKKITLILEFYLAQIHWLRISHRVICFQLWYFEFYKWFAQVSIVYDDCNK